MDLQEPPPDAADPGAPVRAASPPGDDAAATATAATTAAAADAALRESEARFRQLADAMPQIVWAARPDGTVDYYNRRWFEYTGLPDEGVTGDAAWDRVPDAEGARRVSQVWAESVRTGRPYEIECRLRRHDGQYRWHLGRAEPVRDDAGNVVRWFGTNTDIHDQKTVQDALRNSQERYRGLFNSIDQGFCVVEVMFDDAGRPADYRFLEVNPAFEQQTGIADAVGRRMREIAPAHEEHWFETYGRVARTGEPTRFEQVAEALGRVYDVYAFRVDDPGQSRVAVLFKDITESKRIEVALRESERRFRDMADTAPAMLWMTEPDGYCSFLSRGWYEFTGQTEQTGLGFGWTFAAHPDDRAAAGDAFVAANAAREPCAVDFRVRRADGQYRWVIDSGRPRFGAGGEFLGFIGSVIDITDRKRVEDELRESEARLQLAVAIGQMGMFEVDLVTDAVAVNEPGRTIYGWPRGEALTFAKVQSHFHPEDREMVLRRVGEAFAPGGSGEFAVEQRIVRTDGAVRWIRVRGLATGFEADAGGAKRAVRCVGTYLDVTDQKEAERQREQLLAAERAARAEAERAGRMKDEFLATLSHELRTPLNAIVGWASILANGRPDEAELRDGLETILRNARAQTQIIEDLLDMSRIVSGQVRIDVQRVDFAEVLRAAIDTVRPAAEAKGIRLHAALDPSAGDVRGDASRLQQVFWNLLSNAVKFTPRDGHVRVVLGRVESHLEVSVIDTGEGIRTEFLPHVFDRFRQADASTTRRHGGLGLGLAIARQLVELHGGSVRVSSPGPGQGSTFTVALPLAAVQVESRPDAAGGAARRDPAGESGPADRDPCPQLAGVRVLVVDDEPDARSLLRRLLEDCRAVVRTSVSASDALDQIATEPPDVLVSDIGMPGEDGYSLIRRVRALAADRGGNVPAIALTAYARSEDRVRAIRAGFQTHVVKPVEPAELITVVASLAGRSEG